MQMETSGRSVVVLLVMGLFLSAWVAWLLLAQVSVYVVADTAVLTSPTHATAQFTPDALPTIKPGQTALLQIEAFSDPVPATVVEVDQTLVDGRFTVQFRLQPASDLNIPLQAGLNGRVEVEVEQVSPFTLLLRAARQ
jgi:membrane fusion protein (multidrug efflux system)